MDITMDIDENVTIFSQIWVSISIYIANQEIIVIDHHELILL